MPCPPDSRPSAYSSRIRTLSAALILGGAVLSLCSCAGLDRTHAMVVSVPEQRMVLLHKGKPIAEYPVSTSKFGLGDVLGSNCTPTGKLSVAHKIGSGAPEGAVFKHRRRTGEVLLPNSPGRDPIVTRILWLKGEEEANRNAYRRYIYIHGTPEEFRIGSPASFGCIRMRSCDVVDVYDRVGVGAKVHVVERPLKRAERISPRRADVSQRERARSPANRAFAS